VTSVPRGLACAATVLLACLLASGAARALDVESADPPFRTSLPDGFRPTGGRGMQQAFARSLSNGDSIVATFRALPGVITHAVPTEREARAVLEPMAPSARIEIASERAMGLDVPLYIARGDRGDTIVVVAIPTLPHATQLVVSGPGAQSDDVVGTARAVMRSFHARSNWLTDAEVQRRSTARFVLGIAWAVLALYALAYALRRRPGRRVEIAWLLLIAAGFGSAAALLASVPRGATAFDPWTPAIVALVALANLVRIATSKRPISSPSG
jgi:hypothetical protein